MAEKQDIKGKLPNETTLNDGKSKSFFYTGENQEPYTKNSNSHNSTSNNVATSYHSNYQAFKKFQKQLTQNMVSNRPAEDEKCKKRDLNENTDNKNKVLANKIKIGLTNRDDPSQVSFQEESVWLESLVSEEVMANKNKGIPLKHSTDFRIVGSPMLPSPVSSKIAPPVDKFNYKYQRSKSEDVIEDNIVIDKRKKWLEDQFDISSKSNESSSILRNKIELPTCNKIETQDKSSDLIKTQKNKENGSIQLPASFRSQQLPDHSILNDCSDKLVNQNRFDNFSSTIKRSKSIDLYLENCTKDNSNSNTQKYDDEVLTSVQSVKNVAKLFQTPLQSKNNGNDKQSDTKREIYSRPKSYHEGLFNHYDWTSQDNMPKSNKNATKAGSNFIITKNKFGSTNSILSDAEYNADVSITSEQQIIFETKMTEKNKDTPLQIENSINKNQNNTKKGNYTRPISYHDGLFNKYDLTSKDVLPNSNNDKKNTSNVIYASSASSANSSNLNVSKNKFRSTSNIFSDTANIGEILKASELENIIFESNTTATKNKTNQSDFELDKRNVSYGIKNMRVFEDIAETERREQEIREERMKRLKQERKDQSVGESKKQGLVEFLKENAIEL